MAKEEEIQVSIKVLKDSDHFRNFLEYVALLREDALKNLQTPAVIKDTNLHFTTSGMITAYDSLIDNVKDIQNS